MHPTSYGKRTYSRYGRKYERTITENITLGVRVWQASSYSKPLSLYVYQGIANRTPPGRDRPGALRRQLCAGDGSPHWHYQATPALEAGLIDRLDSRGNLGEMEPQPSVTLKLIYYPARVPPCEASAGAAFWKRRD